LSLTTLPVRGPSIGKGGFGEVFIDPDDELLCIKTFQSPLRGPDAQRLLDLVDLVGGLRPSERSLLTTRFAWPLEAFGTGRKILGYRMPRVPESGVFDLIVAGKMSQQVLQAKFLLDPTYWGRSAVQSEAPELVEDGRLLVVADALEAFRLIHSHGYAYEDMSSNNVCVLNEDVPRVFLLDADSVIPIDGASRNIVRSVDWEVDEGLGPAERDWVKAAMFAWRMLLQDRLARPDRASIRDFDDRTGTILGASIVELHEHPGADAVDQLLESVYGTLSHDSGCALIDEARDTRFAREVLRYQNFSQMTAEIRAAAEAQIVLEERVDQATGLQRRLLVRGLRDRGQATFFLDVLPGAATSSPPRSPEELERLILAAEFEGLLDNFLDGHLTALANHPWRDRAIQHALVMEPGPDIEVSAAQGSVTARFSWPPGDLVDLARLRIVRAGKVIDERLIERQPGRPSVRIRGIGSGSPEGERLKVRIVFCVRGEDGGVIECPEDSVVTVSAPAPVLRGGSRTNRAVRIAERRSMRPGEVALDVARPDPNAPKERRRRLRRRMITGAAIMLFAFTLLLWNGGDELRLDAAATRTAGGTEIVWVMRSSAQDPVMVTEYRVERRIIGPIWLGRDHIGETGRVLSGDAVRVSTSSSGTLRVKAQVAGRGTHRSAPFVPLARGSSVLTAPAPVVASSWRLLDGGRGQIEWTLPDPGAGRIAERVQVLVLDVQGEQILRTSTGDLGVILPSSVIALGISGLDVRVRVITSDGMRSDWSRLLTGPLPTAIIPRPTGLEVVESGTGAAAVRWDYTSMNQSTSSRFEVTISQPEPGLSRSLEVDDSAVSLLDIFGDESGIRILRIRAILPDGSRGPSSSAIIVRSAQLGNIS